ncbi:Disease resistance protein (TIR-NBS-LRR class) family [Arabidopsis thaliana]|uniref:ADP-ribosyl cyclase/cyclic ADP-ribose hydrolase n=2 Tax=Arabidopsis thaliana TaxID=3702 RepID=A0A1P8B697_ARATH|nr:Disease resistance protein (TIR-NBS-LRR class) family [Arabidopsis thaliana]ANM67119.1 Disease resistance protein (TIR-NBS-LRR class) family [Arabidopsis thaliana]|eukprot:NP_001328968.1 Disease resistance protein (TIR-NBS-LRR class) family [Arabidopsis thaliana]
MDHGIVRSCIIADELITAIREARISIVIFSENYASSTWCLNELVEIHKCHKDKDLDQMVIPVFYGVDPSHVRKQIGGFGDVFKKTCEDKPEDQKQRWVKALTDISNLAGEDLRNGPSEAAMVVKIANDVSNKLFPLPKGFGDLVGIEDHIEAIKLKLCLESKEARIMVGIWGQSGIGKSTIGRALFSQLSSQFHHRAFITYKSTSGSDVSGMKLSWEKELLSEILGQKDIKIEHFGVVEQRLKHKKVLILLDDVDNLEFLRTLVGKAEWFGSGSRIIVITQDRQLLKAHEIDLIYEVKLPSQGLALKMICQYAFGKYSPPDDFKELAFEVAKLAGNLPLGLSVLGSSLKRRSKEEWMEMLAELQNGLNRDIMKTLRVSYVRLDPKDQDIFHYIAWLFNGWKVKSIKDFLGDGVNVNIRLKTLDDKSLIRLTPNDTIEMHNLLQKLATEIDREESNGNPGKRRFLENAEEILDVFTDNTGTEKLLGIDFSTSSDSQIDKPFISIDENSFQGMLNLQFLNIHDHYWWQPRETRLRLPNGLVYLPRKLKWLRWENCPLKRLPSNFKAEYLVELRMENSALEKLWNGTQPLGSLKKMNLRNSNNLKEIPDLSLATNLEELDLCNCEVLESFPSPLNSESLKFLNLLLCPRLRNFPEIIMQSFIFTDEIEIEVADCLWNKNLPGLDYLDCLRRCNPSKFRPEHLKNLTVRGNNMLEKLWEGVQSLGKLKRVDLSECENMIEIPDLSKATNLEILDLSNCKSLVMLPSTIGNLQKLYTLNMEECTGLKVLPMDINLSSLHTVHLKGCSSLRFIPQISKSIAVLNLDDTAIEEVPCFENFSRLMELSMRGCKSLRRFPQISTSIQELNLADTAIEQVPCFIEKFSRLKVLNMSGCKMLKNISPNIFRLTRLMKVDFTDCGGVITALSDPVTTMEDQNNEKINKVEKRPKCDKDEDDEDEYEYEYDEDEDDEDEYGEIYFKFQNCFKLDRAARELILGSCFKTTMVLPGLLSKLDVNDVEFKFNGTRVKRCGIRLLNVSTSPDDSEGSSETESPDDSDGDSVTEYHQQSGEKCDDVETESSKKRMRMTLGNSEKYFNLPCGQIVTDTVPLGWGESSSVSFNPWLEGEALCVDSMITEQQDAQIHIANVDWEWELWSSSSSSASSS